MKKSVVLLAAVLALSLTACGRKAEQSDSQNETIEEPAVSSETAEETQEESESSEATEPEGTEPDAVSVDSDGTDGADSAETADGTENGEGKTLVVYYSAGGHTQKAAEYIADVTGGDTFELVPAEPYSDEDLDYNDESSRVVYEHDNPEARVIELEETTVSDWDSYDTVFIGYPIWWGIAAWPVDGFIAANDFIGKTVIPFCTSASSGLGESGNLLAEAAGTGDWLEGERFSSSVSEETVTAWVEGLNIE